MIKSIVKIDDKVKYKIDLMSTEGQEISSSSTPPPVINPVLNGWLFTTTSLTDKFVYLFKGNENLAPLLLRNLKYLFMIVTCEAVQNTIDVPFLRVRTVPTGHNDADPMFHSQIDYSLNPTKYQFFNSEKVVLYAGNIVHEPDIFPNLRKIRLDDVYTMGEGEGNELLHTFWCRSLEGVAPGKPTTIHNLGWRDSDGFYQNIKLI